MDKYEIYEIYEKKINRAKSNIIALKSELYADMLGDETGESWDSVIDMLDDAESALIRANAELIRVAHY